jgi:hypothetical protein
LFGKVDASYTESVVQDMNVVLAELRTNVEVDSWEDRDQTKWRLVFPSNGVIPFQSMRSKSSSFELGMLKYWLVTGDFTSKCHKELVDCCIGGGMPAFSLAHEECKSLSKGCDCKIKYSQLNFLLPAKDRDDIKLLVAFKTSQDKGRPPIGLMDDMANELHGSSDDAHQFDLWVVSVNVTIVSREEEEKLSESWHGGGEHQRSSAVKRKRDDVL